MNIAKGQVCFILLILAAVFISGGLFVLIWLKNNQPRPVATVSPTHKTATSSPILSALPLMSANTEKIKLAAPIDRWQERVTKKPFGIFITAQNSPVQPERFSGYHTGVDFETFVDGQNIDMSIFAVCIGNLLEKKWASGYGGVAVQSCNLDNQPVTIIYGHLKLSSISASVDQQINAGEKIGILGAGFSQETGGERKHLHLGIHKGDAINILGYVQAGADLANWLDVTQYLTK